MIPTSFIQAWSEKAPWPDARQIEQDLIICRALCDLFNAPELKNKIAFRGGTAINKLLFREPTESESKASLDLFIAALRDLAMAAKRGDTARFSGAPYYAPRRRLDETRAARQPVLRWTKPAAQAAE